MKIFEEMSIEIEGKDRHENNFSILDPFHEHTARKTTNQRNWVTFYSFTWGENLPLVWRCRTFSLSRIA